MQSASAHSGDEITVFLIRGNLLPQTLPGVKVDGTVVWASAVFNLTILNGKTALA